MGYVTAIRLEGVRIKKKSIPEVKKYIADHKRETESFHYFLENVEVDSEGCLQWVGFPTGKWYRDEEFVEWLKQYAASGTVTLISQEGDRAAWGYKFDGRGGVRPFDPPPPPPPPIVQDLDSGPLRRMKYDPEGCVLKLEFSGGKVYRYEGVPYETAEEMAASGGGAITFFNEAIRHGFESRPDKWEDEGEEPEGDAEELAMEASGHADDAKENLHSAVEAMEAGNWNKAAGNIRLAVVDVNQARRCLRRAAEQQRRNPLPKTAKWRQQAESVLGGVESTIGLLQPPTIEMNRASTKTSREVAGWALDLGGEPLQQLLAQAEYAAGQNDRERAALAVSHAFQLTGAISALLSAAEEMLKTDKARGTKPLLRKGGAVIADFNERYKKLEPLLEGKKKKRRGKGAEDTT